MHFHFEVHYRFVLVKVARVLLVAMHQSLTRSRLNKVGEDLWTFKRQAIAVSFRKRVNDQMDDKAVDDDLP